MFIKKLDIFLTILYNALIFFIMPSVFNNALLLCYRVTPVSGRPACRRSLISCLFILPPVRLPGHHIPAPPSPKPKGCDCAKKAGRPNGKLYQISNEVTVGEKYTALDT